MAERDRLLDQVNSYQFPYEPDQYLPEELRGDPLQFTPTDQLRRAQLLEEALGSVTSPGQTDTLHRNAYKTFQDLLGRAPTEQEFASIIPYFQGENGLNTGRAYLAEYAQAYENSPEAIASRAGQYSGQVGDAFQSLLGRGASQSELDYYGRLLASNYTPYEVEQAIKGTQEYRQAEDQRFRQGLAGELEGYDTSFFNKARQGIEAQAARNAGGAGRSTALDFALTQLMGDIAERRGQYLSNLSAQQYGSNKDAARSDYRSSMDQYLRDRDYQRNQNQRDADYFRQRSDQNLDYQIQKRDYENFLNSQRGRTRGYGRLAGTLVGGAAGAYFGKDPRWAQFGANMGGAGGGAFDYLD